MTNPGDFLEGQTSGCPLGEGLYWESSTNLDSIPAYCRERCGKFMSSIAVGTEKIGDYDTFDLEDDSSCDHNQWGLSADDSSLSRGEGQERIFGILDVCEGCNAEHGGQNYLFICPADGGFPKIQGS